MSNGRSVSKLVFLLVILLAIMGILYFSSSEKDYSYSNEESSYSEDEGYEENKVQKGLLHRKELDSSLQVCL